MHVTGVIVVVPRSASARRGTDELVAWGRGDGRGARSARGVKRVRLSACANCQRLRLSAYATISACDCKRVAAHCEIRAPSSLA
jgi:hypothetical protein